MQEATATELCALAVVLIYAAVMFIVWLENRKRKARKSVRGRASDEHFVEIKAKLDFLIEGQQKINGDWHLAEIKATLDFLVKGQQKINDDLADLRRRLEPDLFQVNDFSDYLCVLSSSLLL